MKHILNRAYFYHYSIFGVGAQLIIHAFFSKKNPEPLVDSPLYRTAQAIRMEKSSRPTSLQVMVASSTISLFLMQSAKKNEEERKHMERDFSGVSVHASLETTINT